MDQLSLPFRIALVALLAVAALWFTVLRPKPPVAPPPSAPGVTGLAKDVDAAKGAAAASDAANAATHAATAPAAKSGAAAGPKAASGAAPAPGATAKPAAGADRSAPLLRALDGHRAVVLLFFNRRAVEDRAVRRAVAGVDRRHGRVVVKAAPIGDVGRYRAITAGAQVLQSPTALVIAPDRTARPVVGFTTTAELDQAVGDALAARK